MSRLVVGLIAVALAVSACGGSAGAGELRDRGDGQNFVGGDGTVTTVAAGERDRAPSLQGTTLAGEPLDLDDYLGSVVVLNVWGSWCTPCRAEAPTLERVYLDLRPQGVEFVGINTRDDEEKARAFERTKNITYPSVVDEDGELLLEFHETLPPSAIPSTLVIDREGRMAARVIGPVTESKLRDVVEPVLAES
jgi:thiol-disulfide isomerase/thioredoxin